ncbi:MAG: hypothetical protein QMD05_10785 [Candidatus Brocadiaceae bacterium]|nr:hypothetical protein [Candidatus Brocadiaceae bacterium]
MKKVHYINYYLILFIFSQWFVHTAQFTKDVVAGSQEGQITKKEKTEAKPEEKPYRDFPMLRVELKSLRVSSDAIVVNLSFLNKTEEDLLVIIDAEGVEVPALPGREKVFVIDDLGNRAFIKSASGIGFAQSSVSYPGRFSQGNCLTCPPQTPSIASLTFSPYKGSKEPGTNFSITIPIAVGKKLGNESILNTAISFEDVSPSTVSIK